MRQLAALRSGKTVTKAAEVSIDAGEEEGGTGGGEERARIGALLEREEDARLDFSHWRWYGGGGAERGWTAPRASRHVAGPRVDCARQARVKLTWLRTR